MVKITCRVPYPLKDINIQVHIKHAFLLVRHWVLVNRTAFSSLAFTVCVNLLGKTSVKGRRGTVHFRNQKCFLFLMLWIITFYPNPAPTSTQTAFLPSGWVMEADPLLVSYCFYKIYVTPTSTENALMRSAAMSLCCQALWYRIWHEN